MADNTGSAVPADDSKIKHSGAGRFAFLTMRPMTLWESEESSGDVSLSELFSHPDKIEDRPSGFSSLFVRGLAPPLYLQDGGMASGGMACVWQ